MKAAMARKITCKHFFAIFLGLLSVFSFGNSVWAYSVAQNRDCAGNCESDERLAAFTHNKTSDARVATFTPADRISALQYAALGSGVDVQVAAPGSIPSKTDQVPTSAQSLNLGTEGGSTPGPRFFLLIGLALIGVRLVISHRSRKVKNLATGTH
jgi:hypothetical protein